MKSLAVVAGLLALAGLPESGAPPETQELRVKVSGMS